MRDAARALVRLNRHLLHAFSRRTSAALRGAVPLRIALPQLERFLAQNVDKEVEKDARVIRRAAQAHASGRACDRAALRELLGEARDVDRRFLARVGGLPVGIVIPYGEIEPLRLRRMERIAAGVQRVLDAGPGRPGLRAALRAAYPAPELERLVRDVLFLYAQETQLLSRAVQLPRPLTLVREAVGRHVREVMEAAATGLAREAERSVARRGR